MNKQILLLRTFRDLPEDDLDIALLIKVCKLFGKLVIVGTKSGNLKFKQALLSTGLLKTEELDRTVRFVNSTDDSWKIIVINLILLSDAIIIRFTPKTLKFPDLNTPTPRNDVNFFEYYQSPFQDIHTGAGLLTELAYCSRLDMLDKCLLLVNEWQIRNIEEIINLTSFGSGDIFKASASYVMEPQKPRFTALDLQIASMREIKNVLALPRRDILFSNPGYIKLVGDELSKRLMKIVESDITKYNSETRKKLDFLDYGISEKPKKIFPDYEYKIVRYTPVEKLLAMSPGQLIEIDFNTVIRDFGLKIGNATCPYCQAKRDKLFFYQYGLNKSQKNAIRCKCQNCTRRSTIYGDILMDQ